MKGKAYSRSLFTIQSCNVDFFKYHCNILLRPYTNAYLFSTTTESSTRSSPLLGNRVEEAEVVGSPKCSTEVLRNFGCSEIDIQKIFSRQPSLRNAFASPLDHKLYLLRKLGIKSSELIKIINCRPRFLNCGLNKYFDERLDNLESLFGSRELLTKAIVRNPSLLLYDFEKKVVPVFSLYEELGLSRSDMISMLMLRPTLIPRTHMTPEKLDYIHRTGISSESKMYKYVVTIIGVSRSDTIREKVANFERFGFSEDEVLQFFGRSPLLLTLSVEKVQRSMTFVMGTMKLPAKTVCDYPFLLFCSLEVLLKPRVLLVSKIRDMGLGPQIDVCRMMTALRMSEQRFLKVFVNCQKEEVRNELLLYYRASQGIRRLAETSRKVSSVGFPF